MLTAAEAAVIIDLLQWRAVEPEPPPEVGSALTKVQELCAAGYSEQEEHYDADLIADLESKAARWKSKPWGPLLAEAAARLRVLSPTVEPPPSVVRDPSRTS